MSIETPAPWRQPTWVEDAICAQTDPELFFPNKGGNPEPARRICAQCPVQAKCLELAILDPSLDGIWGGTTYRDRIELRRPGTQGRAA
jgi:WhiB family redox-sensing transcriptional regulator